MADNTQCTAACPNGDGSCKNKGVHSNHTCSTCGHGWHD